MSKFRIGFGYDVHPLKKGEDFVLGGIQISHEKGPAGHSDADVLIHAICDALLGAANLGDIGTHFPPAEEQYKNIESSLLLEKIVQMIRQQGYQPGNLDSTICLERPKIKDHIEKMKTFLAPILTTDKSNLSIKATTTEKLGFTGREEGIAAYAVVLIEKI